jgi:hypothetical protein
MLRTSVPDAVLEQNEDTLINIDENEGTNPLDEECLDNEIRISFKEPSIL